MKVLVASDLHIEFHADGGQALLDELPTSGVDVCVLAGDVCAGHDIPRVAEMFCERFPDVIYVHGNHEFYNGRFEAVHAVTRQATERFERFHWLDHSAVEIGGVRFLGAPLWFRQASGAPKQYMSDFHVIAGFEDWVYAENAKAIEYLTENVTRDDVVVTHHLPSQRSVSPQYRGHPLNPFFVCELDSLIERAQPQLWIHGHTHDSVDYRIGDTRVLCNPFGYPDELNARFEPGLVVDI